ncbi:hypothetical protein PENTCL1PPCAC_10986, partial [Pristionchus entomophagus]
VTLFYFCKSCDFGSTDSLLLYQHFMIKCPRGYPTLRMQGEKSEDHASKCIGVCPASLLHFQPINLKTHKADLDKHPEKYVVPSLCSHRTMMVAREKIVTCDTCRCFEPIATHAALYELKTRQPWERKFTTAVCLPPLIQIRRQYETWLRDMIDIRAPTVPPGHSVIVPTSVLIDRALLNVVRQAQQNLNDRPNGSMQARGGMRSENGEEGGRMPVPTGVGRSSQDIGGMMMRGPHVPNPMDNGMLYGGGGMRGMPGSSGVGGDNQNGGGMLLNPMSGGIHFGGGTGGRMRGPAFPPPALQPPHLPHPPLPPPNLPPSSHLAHPPLPNYPDSSSSQDNSSTDFFHDQ